MAEQIQQVIKKLKLDSLDSNQSLTFVKARTGLRPSQISFAVIVFLTIILVIAQASTLVLCIGCFLIPAYFSFNSLQSSDFKPNVKYLTYWVVFSFTELVSFILEYIFGPIVYAIFRVAFTVMMIHPSFELSQKIYYNFIAPYVMGYQKTIDKKLEELTSIGKNKLDEVEKRAKNEISNLMKKTE